MTYSLIHSSGALRVLLRRDLWARNGGYSTEVSCIDAALRSKNSWNELSLKWGEATRILEVPGCQLGHSLMLLWKRARWSGQEPPQGRSQERLPWPQKEWVGYCRWPQPAFMPIFVLKSQLDGSLRANGWIPKGQKLGSGMSETRGPPTLPGPMPLFCEETEGQSKVTFPVSAG